MTERLIEKIDRLANEAGIKDVTPEIRKFALLVRADVVSREWVGLTEAQFLEAVRLAENGNYLVAFVRIQEWLKEQNT